MFFSESQDLPKFHCLDNFWDTALLCLSCGCDVTSYRTTPAILIPGETKVNVIVADIVQPQPKGLGWALLNSLVYAASVPPPVWKSKLFSTITYTLQDLSRPKNTNTVKYTVTFGYNSTLHFMFNIV